MFNNIIHQSKHESGLQSSHNTTCGEWGLSEWLLYLASEVCFTSDIYIYIYIYMAEGLHPREKS